MRSIKAVSVILLMVPMLSAATRKPFAQGTIVDLRQKTSTRVLYYQVDTPITQDDPYYEITVRIHNMQYVGRYTPMHASDTLPAEWTAGAAVEARIDGRHLILKRPNGTEMIFAIAKSLKVKTGQPNSRVAPDVK